ncbi:MAG: helix-hairpin-helix domain-containing protein [Candidatus Eisenbacteria bacterium]|nr:helix-hairpin-helix domain-containing protein [Candidatus Eisenbacteria bacterium]
MGGGVFTREERAVVLFLVASLSVGCAILGARRHVPEAIPDFSRIAEEQAPEPGLTESKGPVDINAAGVEELTELPGVGPVRAAAIVRLRDQRGRFNSVDDLLDVRGIGPVTLERMRPMATAGPAVNASTDSCRTTSSPTRR